MQWNQDEKFNQIVAYLEQNGCDFPILIPWLQNQKEFFSKWEDDITKHISFLYNHKDLYAIVFAYEDDYCGVVYQGGQLFPFGQTEENLFGHDYIVEMMIHFGDTKKIAEIVPEIHGMNVENKMKVLKNVKFNLEGYHFR